MRERRLGDVQVVLAAYREDHPTACQLRGVALEGEKRLAAGAALAELDTVDTVITDHTAHRVLSRSSTRHLCDSPAVAAAIRAR